MAHGQPADFVRVLPILKVDYQRIVERIFFKPDAATCARWRSSARTSSPTSTTSVNFRWQNTSASFADLGSPLVVAAQGYEVCQRQGIDVLSAIRKNEGRIDVLLSGSQANVHENIDRDLPYLVDRTKVMHYGIVDDESYAMSEDEARRRSEKFVRPTNEFVIMALSRIDVEKGTDLALHALRILLNQGIRARLRLIGDAWSVGISVVPSSTRCR